MIRKDISNDKNIKKFNENNRFFNAKLKNVNYDINNSEIILNVVIDNKEIKIIFESVYKCEIKEIHSNDTFGDIELYFTKIDNTEYLYFASEEEEPLIYIISKKIYYEE